MKAYLVTYLFFTQSEVSYLPFRRSLEQFTRNSVSKNSFIIACSLTLNQLHLMWEPLLFPGDKLLIVEIGDLKLVGQWTEEELRWYRESIP